MVQRRLDEHRHHHRSDLRHRCRRCRLDGRAALLDEPVAESDQVLPARPLQNANLIEPSTTTMAYAASAEESGQPASAQQSGQPSNHSRRKFWIAITPLIVAGAYILIIYLLAPST